MSTKNPNLFFKIFFSKKFFFNCFFLFSVFFFIRVYALLVQGHLWASIDSPHKVWSAMSNMLTIRSFVSANALVFITSHHAMFYLLNI